MAPTKKRASYTAAFKLEVVAYADEHGNRPAGRQFGVRESLVQDWRKKEDLLHTVKETKRAVRGQKLRWGQLEDDLATWVAAQRKSCRGVSTVQIRMKVKEMAKKMDITDFQGGPSGCLRFMRRNSLSIRTRTNIAQKLPEDHQDQLDSFQDFIQKKSTDFGFTADHVINMDEVPLTIDIPMRP